MAKVNVKPIQFLFENYFEILNLNFALTLCIVCD